MYMYMYIPTSWPFSPFQRPYQPESYTALVAYGYGYGYGYGFTQPLACNVALVNA